MTHKERPLTLSAYWVRAILDRRKRETRRVMSVEAFGGKPCPLGRIGDRLWVRETWMEVGDQSPAEMLRVPIYRADASLVPHKGPWKSSRFMPRWASRIDLRITDLKSESLWDITDLAVRSEGVRSFGLRYESPVNPAVFHAPGPDRFWCACARRDPIIGTPYDDALPPALCAWREGWDAIHGAPGIRWIDDPPVWVVSFEIERIGILGNERRAQP